MRIGFVGLGAMGQAMALRLLDRGHELVVHNRTRARAEPLLAAGARFAGTPAEAASDTEVVFSMVADDAALEAIVTGEAGIAAGLPSGGLHVSSSTVSVRLTRDLAALHESLGRRFLSAPVLGRPPAARDGTLFVLTAGSETAKASAAPILADLGQRVFPLGDDPTAAALLKLSLNFLIFSTIEQMGEVFALNEKNGTPPKAVFDVLVNSFFGAPVHRNYGRLMVERSFENPGAPLSLAAKDTRLLLEAGEALNVALPMGSLVRDRLLASMARGDESLDFASLSDRAREDAGLPTG
ncbi:NAD(P)-dependent oxidoreductase [Acetobacteraceae bacterium KSS8]|uniref:NAD(P)-dependent oxidoreductase n=1 Tax=Endosaccharibacter trunci TaxID=2812733 RepID=A0ABT1W4S3_9PROT|nr:NAD(P)-dependent oxidoreductase [Acetobacteraceae bacterium KSS8]